MVNSSGEREKTNIISVTSLLTSVATLHDKSGRYIAERHKSGTGFKGEVSMDRYKLPEISGSTARPVMCFYESTSPCPKDKGGIVPYLSLHKPAP
jgi:hypothetical protein